MKIILVAGARPNFMKVAPLVEALKEAKLNHDELNFMLVHTGQHYDEQMSKYFFDDLGLPYPDIDLEIGSGTYAEQTGKIMMAFENLLEKEKPDWVVVVGDVNSTMACAITAKKHGSKVAHVEAGLRSRDWTMPEEINRCVTDVLCDLLFTTDIMASDNLENEGIDSDRIHFVGNVMIDSLLEHREKALKLRQWERLHLKAGSYGVLTLHRPSNVDDPNIFQGIVSALGKIQKQLPLVFPVHPRTEKMAKSFGLWEKINSLPNLHAMDSLGYLEMLSLTGMAKLIITDSGGLQEEAVALCVPCLTLRDNTERPVTITAGANKVVGNNAKNIIKAVNEILTGDSLRISQPDKWDGNAAKRIVNVLMERI